MLASVYFTAVRCPTNSTPAIKAISLLVVRRKKLKRGRFFFLTFCTRQRIHYLQFHRLRLAAFLVGRPFSSFIGPGMPLILAQNDLRLAASFSVLGLGAGAFRLDPVARLYLARPLAVKPAPSLTGSFSPRPTARDGFLAITFSSPLLSCPRDSGRGVLPSWPLPWLRSSWPSSASWAFRDLSALVCPIPQSY